MTKSRAGSGFTAGRFYIRANCLGRCWKLYAIMLEFVQTHSKAELGRSMSTTEERNKILREPAREMWRRIGTYSQRYATRYDGPHELWKDYGVAILAVLRGWNDSDLGVAASNARVASPTSRKKVGIRDILGDDWCPERMDGDSIILSLAAVSIIAAMMEVSST